MVDSAVAQTPRRHGESSSEELIYMLHGLGIETGVDLSKAAATPMGHQSAMEPTWLDSKVNESINNWA